MYFTRLSTFFRNDSDTSINITVPNDTHISTNLFEIKTNRNVITSMKQRENGERFDAVNYQSLFYRIKRCRSPRTKYENNELLIANDE